MAAAKAACSIWRVVEVTRAGAVMVPSSRPNRPLVDTQVIAPPEEGVG
jgi:hypothetical protein